MQAIILCAGAGTRLGMGPKCLVEIGGRTLLRSQIDAIRAVDDTALIIVVTGFECRAVEQEIERIADPLVRPIRNEAAAQFGVVRSIEIARRQIFEPTVLRLSGDLYFASNTALIPLMQCERSCLGFVEARPRNGAAVLLTASATTAFDFALVAEPRAGREWIDADLYRNGDLDRIMTAALWYERSTQHYYQLLRHAMRSGVVLVPQTLHDVFEIDTKEDYAYVRSVAG